MKGSSLRGILSLDRLIVDDICKLLNTTNRYIMSRDNSLYNDCATRCQHLMTLHLKCSVIIAVTHECIKESMKV